MCRNNGASGMSATLLTLTRSQSRTSWLPSSGRSPGTAGCAAWRPVIRAASQLVPSCVAALAGQDHISTASREAAPTSDVAKVLSPGHAKAAKQPREQERVGYLNTGDAGAVHGCAKQPMATAIDMYASLDVGSEPSTAAGLLLIDDVHFPCLCTGPLPGTPAHSCLRLSIQPRRATSACTLYAAAKTTAAAQVLVPVLRRCAITGCGGHDGGSALSMPACCSASAGSR